VVASSGPLVGELCVSPMTAVVNCDSRVEFCAASGTDGVFAAVVEATVGPVVAEVCVVALVAVVVALTIGDLLGEGCAGA
jgi:hypothetical protein